MALSSAYPQWGPDPLINLAHGVCGYWWVRVHSKDLRTSLQNKSFIRIAWWTKVNMKGAGWKEKGGEEKEGTKKDGLEKDGPPKL